MGFNIHTSNNIESLSESFCTSISKKANWTDVTHIIVQTKGLEKWLTQQVTRQNKIFANYEFSSPDGFIGELFRRAKIYSNAYFSAESMKWKLFVLLNDEVFKSEFTSIASYYEGDDVKRIQLASKTADLFDQYLVYRPDYIEAWNTNSFATTNPSIADDFKKHEVWQKWLWTKLKNDSNEELDKLEQKDLLLNKMNDDAFQLRLKRAFPKISLFGIAVISNFHIEIYQKLATIIDVDLFITSPSDNENWYSTEYNNKANELLSSCKTLSSDMFSLLAAQESTIHNSSTKPIASDLLSTIQSDIFNNDNTAIKSYHTEQKDKSVHIVSSYTPVREVEALYNYLLNEFENDSSLKASDISVQLTDVNLYAPLIKAVFDNAPKKIPYQITDLAYSNGDSLIKALEFFIALPFSNYKAEHVMQLLEFQAIRNRFDITDVEEIRTIIADANIRYGIPGKKEDDTYLFSWNHGLTKLILGYAIKGGETFVKDDTEFYPTDSVEGSEALNIFRLKAFIDTLFNLLENTNGEKTIIEWKEFLLNEVLGDLFAPDDSYAEELEYIYKKLENIENIAEHIDEKITFIVFQQGLFAMLSTETKNSNYLSGLLTFSSIIPVRSIPFKHIAILGLNAGVFPRQQNELGFDLIALEPRENDRNTKNNDKYLFLEAILASRKQLYLSYIGSSISDNSELPPSLLIEELEDYLITGTKNSQWLKENIIYEHPLHATSKRYFSNERLFTYLGKTDDKNDSKTNQKSTAIEQALSFTEIDIDDLIRFYKDPFKWYYNKTLRIYYSDDDILLPEEEPFHLDALQKWALKSDLVRLQETEEAEYIKRKKNFGQILLANMAYVELDSQKEAIAEVKNKFEETVSGDSSTRSISIKIGESYLKGKIASIYNEGFVHTNVSGNFSQPKYIMEAWIKHLALTACDENSESTFISSSHQFKITKDAIDSATAKHTLQQLIAIYQKGHSQAIPFTAKEGMFLITNIYEKNMPEAKAIDKSLKNIKNDKYRSEYVIKEDSFGLFDLLLADEDTLSESDKQSVNEKRELFMKISELLFSKITLIAQ